MERKSEFDPKTAAKKLLREGRSGALATLMPGSGDPYCSLVNVATAADGEPLLLLSRLALHTKNILADPRVSLMIDERKLGDPLEGARVMLMGRASATDDPEVRRRLSRPPAGSRNVRRVRRFRVLSRCALAGAFGRRVRPYR
jgi:heme iron utilization protein